jgi:probable O-glycosylation ligase (exosortase A-associated)
MITDLTIIAIVITTIGLSLTRPWVGILLWTWISLMNPHRFSYGFTYSLPLAMISALVIFIGLFATKDRQSPFKDTPVTLLFIFFIWLTLSWLFGVDPSGDYALWDKVMKIDLMIFISLAVLNNKHQIMAFIVVCVGSLAIIGTKGGIFTVLTGGNYRVWGPPGSYIEGNNEFALAIIMIVPLLYFLQQQTTNKWGQRLLMVSMLLCTASALGSQSRGALLALIAMGGTFWLRSNRKGLIATLIVIVGTALIPMMPDSWFNRMETIETYEEDGSAMGRINAWKVATEVAKTHFFGAGMVYQHQHFFDMYGTYETTVRAAHSIYFQILGNHGFIGLALFIMIFVATYFTADWLRKNTRSIPEATWTADLGAMIQASLVGYAIGGAFLSLAYFDLPYYLMVMTVATKYWVVTKGWERDPQEPFWVYIGLKKSPQTDLKQH